MKKIAAVNFISVLIILILSTFISCSEDSPSNPKEQEPSTLSTKTITSAGGSIITDNVEIEIPSGAFSSSQEIKILESTEDNMFGEKAFSSFYTLDGLPLEINKPIKIRMKYNGTITDSSFIAIGETNFTSSLNAETTSYQLISARDSAGYLRATIPPLSNATLEKTTSNYSINKDKLSINLGAIAGLVNYVSDQGHFRITFPSSVITQAYDLADYLESAYSKLESKGFTYSKRTKWPVNVTVKVLENDKYGYCTNSLWGNNYGYLEINFNKIDESENIKVTAGHEFFHLVQNLYDPRSSWSKAKSPMPNYWLDEAASVWAEEFFSGKSGYCSPIFEYNVADILKGAKTGNLQDESQNYGYGMASFLKFLTKTEGDNKVAEVYNNISNGKSPFKAISELLPINAGYSWHSFLRNLFTFNLYSGDSFGPGVLLSYATGKKQKFVIKSASDSLATYKSKLPDLSATVFSVDNKFSAMASNSILEFTCKGWNFQLYKINSSKSEFYKSGKDILTVENFKKLTDDGYKIIAVLYNSDYDSPFEHEENYEMEIKLKTQVKIKSVNIGIAFTGSFTETYPEKTYSTHEQSTLEGIFNGGNGSITGNTFTGTTATSLGIYDQVSNISISFDNIINPTKVTAFSINNEGNDTFVNAIINESAIGQNIQLTNNQDNLAQFGYYGNINSYISTLTYTSTRPQEFTKPDGTTYTADVIRQLVGFDSEGIITIFVEYE